MPIFQPLPCYEQLNVSRHCKIQQSIVTYEPPLRLLPHLASSVPLELSFETYRIVRKERWRSF